MRRHGQFGHFGRLGCHVGPMHFVSSSISSQERSLGQGVEVTPTRRHHTHASTCHAPGRQAAQLHRLLLKTFPAVLHLPWPGSARARLQAAACWGRRRRKERKGQEGGGELSLATLPPPHLHHTAVAEGDRSLLPGEGRRKEEGGRGKQNSPLPSLHQHSALLALAFFLKAIFQHGGLRGQTGCLGLFLT